VVRTSLACLVLILVSVPALASGPEWQDLAPGMDLTVIEAQKRSIVGDSRITVVRIDPALWDLGVAGMSQTGETNGRSAREWCQRGGFVAAINAGMFATDGSTHVGYLRFAGHTNSGQLNSYQSVAAFDPQDSTVAPRFRLFDLDAPGVTMADIRNAYASVAQNLRLIKRPGSNRWSQQPKMWSEAALGEDDQGRILFIFSRSPFTMHDFNQELLRAGIGIVAAQHLEGGPEAQLYLRIGDFELDLVGSYETGFTESDSNLTAWPIPNVLGIRQLVPRPEE